MARKRCGQNNLMTGPVDHCKVDSGFKNVSIFDATLQRETDDTASTSVVDTSRDGRAERYTIARHHIYS